MSNDFKPADLRIAACKLAELGGETARRYFGRASVSRKADDTPVTEADHATQGAILDALAGQFPSHAILVEEEVADPDQHTKLKAADYCWVVDPIDGTRSYARGIGVYSTSVAVLHNGEPIAGAIHDATTGKIYSAAKGSGAFVDDRPMVIEDRPINTDTTVMISSFRRRTVPDAVRRWMDRYLFRNQGSLCLHLAWVAADLADAAYAIECKLWDVSAGTLLVQEAGGIVTDHTGKPIWPRDISNYRDEDIPILVGSQTMHPKLLSTLVDDGLHT
ncbi:MAG: inositol monophosphatase [Phycisphaerales bacterium]|nr:inositol monophosphatase [Phycisphaerales bacterium]